MTVRFTNSAKYYYRPKSWGFGLVVHAALKKCVYRIGDYRHSPWMPTGIQLDKDVSSQSM
jgi:hypothetical protein